MEERIGLFFDELDRIGRSLGRRRASVLAAATSGGTAILFLSYHLVDLLFRLPPEVRSGLGLVLISFFTVGVGSAIFFLFFGKKREAIAAWLEKGDRSLRQDLTTVVQCAGREGYSLELIFELAERCRKRINLVELEPKSRVIWWWMASALSIIVLLTTGLVWPRAVEISLIRLARPWGVVGDWSKLKVLPGDSRIPSDESLEVAIGSGEGPAYVLLDTGDKIVMSCAPGSGEEALSASLPPAKGDFRYRIFWRRLQSREYAVSVFKPLALEGISIRLTPPAYTGLSSVVLDNQGSFEAVLGTRALITAGPSQEVGMAAALLGSGDIVPANIDKQGIALELKVTGDQRYRLMAVSAGGADSFISAEYRITAQPDLPPQVELWDEELTDDIGENYNLSVEGRASDDFGLSQVRIGYLLNGQESTGPRIKPSGRVVDTSVVMEWDLSGLGLLPGDSMAYWLEAVDNDMVSGPKSGRSRSRWLRLPSLADIYQMTADRDSAVAAEVAGIQPEQTELREQIQRLSQAIKESRRIDWQQQAALEKAVADQQELLSRLEQAADKALESLRPEGRRVEIDAETASKIRELHQLFEQVATEEMRQAMERLSQALENMDRGEVTRALDNMKLTSEELKKRLDQAIAALKEMQQQRQLDKMREDLRRLVKEQQEIKEATGRELETEEAAGLARRQEQAAKDLEALADRARQLGEQMDSPTEAAEALKRSAEGIRQKGTPSKMSRAGQKINEGNRQGARDLQQQALEDMAELSQGMDKASSSMSMARSRARAQALRQRAREALSLSQQQEDLNRQIGSGGDQNELAQRQQSLARATSRLQSQSGDQLKIIPPQAAGSLSRALQAMGRSGQEIMGGRLGQSQQQGQEAVAALNQAAAAMLEAASRSGGSQGSGDMMQDLEGLSSQQSEINQKTLGLMPSAGGQEALSQEIRSQMARLAAQQEAVRQGLQEFERKYADRRDRTGRLDDLAAEMQQAAEDLRQQRADESTRQRQERILNRLLQAQRSLRDQDHSQQRKAEPGKISGQRDEGRRPTTEGIPPPPPDKAWRKEPYPLEYKEIIERYFRSLGW